MQEVERFFINYNEQAGKSFRPLELMTAAQALKQIQKAQDNASPTRLIQFLLPLYDQKKKPFLKNYYTAVENKLTERFGGVTIYKQSPASGLWKKGNKRTVTDDLVVFEVMAGDVDGLFWKKYKTSLQKKFSQEDIVIRQSEIGLL